MIESVVDELTAVVDTKSACQAVCDSHIARADSEGYATLRPLGLMASGRLADSGFALADSGMGMAELDRALKDSGGRRGWLNQGRRL